MSAAAISAPLAALFEEHRIALEADERAHAEVCRIDDLPELKERPFPRVQVGQMVRFGRNEDGTESHDPIFAYSLDGIERNLAPHRDVMLSLQGDGPGSEARKQKVRDGYAALVATKATELQALEDRHCQMEDAAGLTAANEAANEACEKVKVLEAKIVGYVAPSLTDAAAIAAWVVAGMADDATGYLSDEAPIEALKSIAKAGGSNV